MGNKSLWIGTDEQGEEHELDGSEKPAKMEKQSPKLLKEAAEVLGMAQGPKGEDADEDYIIEAVIPRVLEMIRQPEDGKDGADADIELIIREMLPLVMEKMPKPEKINEASIVSKVLSRIRIPQDGKPGEKGKDGSPDTAVQVKEKLETLKGDERLDASAIKNLPKQVTQIGGGHSYTGLAKVDATGTPGTLQEKIVAGTNVTITKINDTLRIASSGGGGGGGQVDSIVAGNNIDVDATDPANPVVSVETLTLADISDITASATEVNYTDGVTSAIQTQLDGKQPLDSDLTTIAGLTATTDNFLQSKSSAWASRTPTQVTADLIAMVGDSGSGGTKGLVPAPASGDATKVLSGAGTWVVNGAGGSGITRTVVVTSGSATMGSTASTDYAYFVAGAHTMSLPAASGNTNRYSVKNNHSANITVDTAGAETVEGAASISIAPEESVDLMSNGTNWFVI